MKFNSTLLVNLVPRLNSCSQENKKENDAKQFIRKYEMLRHVTLIEKVSDVELAGQDFFPFLNSLFIVACHMPTLSSRDRHLRFSNSLLHFYLSYLGTFFVFFFKLLIRGNIYFYYSQQRENKQNGSIGRRIFTMAVSALADLAPGFLV